MSWQQDEYDANRDMEEQPADWNDKEDSEQWKREAQQELDGHIRSPSTNTVGSHRRTDTMTTDVESPTKPTKSRKRTRGRTVSSHFNLESTEPLSANDSLWIAIKSGLLWIYLVIISTGVMNYQSHSPQTIWIIAYFILFIFWCLFFRLTASTSRGGFYPLMGDWKCKIYHTILFLLGLAGLDMYFLQKKKIIMRECVMQYKVCYISSLHDMP